MSSDANPAAVLCEEGTDAHKKVRRDGKRRQEKKTHKLVLAKLTN